MAVELERDDLCTRLGQREGERPEAGTDLEHAVAVADPRQAHDSAGGVRIGEEVLAQRAARAQPVLREQGAHGRRREEAHPR